MTSVSADVKTEEREFLSEVAEPNTDQLAPVEMGHGARETKGGPFGFFSDNFGGWQPE